MTTPVDFQAIIPLKWKPVVALIGSVLTLVGPYVLANANLLPNPWPLVIGFVFAAATALGVYQAPYKPAGTVLAALPSETKVSELEPGVPVAIPAATTATVNTVGDYRNPWKD